MVESERDLWRSLVQSLFSCRATWSFMVSNTMSIPCFSISPRMKIPENLCQCPVTLTMKKCFLMSRGNLLSVPITSGAVKWAPLRTLPVLFDIPFKYLYTLMASSWAFSSPDWTVTALWAFPHQRDASVPFIIFVTSLRGLSIIFEQSWQSGEVSKNWRKGDVTSE